MTTPDTARRIADLEARLRRAAAEGRSKAKPYASERTKHYRSGATTVRREYR